MARARTGRSVEMNAEDRVALPPLTYMGGTRALTTTPVVGAPAHPYPEVFVPLWEELRDGEMRVTVLGSGNPPPTRAQASGSVLVEVGNAERDMFLFDVGSGSLANFISLQLPINGLDKVFLSHLHADPTADLITLSGSSCASGGPPAPSPGSVPSAPSRPSPLRAPGTPSPRAGSPVTRARTCRSRSSTP